MCRMTQSSHNIFWPSALLLLVVSIFIGLALWSKAPLWELALRSDNSAISWLSSAQLWAGALLVLRLSVERQLPVLLGIILCLALVGLALDEQFMYHEYWKYSCEDWLSLCRLEWMRELPMQLIGIGGLILFLFLHRAIPHRPLQIQLWLALVIGFLAIAVDQLPFLPASIAVFEEVFEVLAETLFLGLLLSFHQPNPASVKT